MYWWVNQGPTGRQEIDGGYLWSPKRARQGRGNVTHDNVTRVTPGDVLFSYSDGTIDAIGVALDRAHAATMPGEPGKSAKPARRGAGWLLPVRFEALDPPLVPAGHMDRLAGALPAKHPPIRATGERNSSVHLAEVPTAMATVLRELLGGQLQRIEAQIAIETDGQLMEAALEEQIWQRADLAPWEKRQQVNARQGQGTFRENVERIEQACRVTGVLDRRHLRASHIKPWRLCDDRERLDGCNGLLLSPHIAQLFLRGHVSFADDGRLLISRHLNPSVVKAWGLAIADPPPEFRAEQRGYLEFHRRHVFEKLSAGRRG